jgi:hypothetical protein
VPVFKIQDDEFKQGIFHIKNINRTASLFLDLLRGLRIASIKDSRSFVIELEEYKNLLERTTALTEMFIKGM